MSAALYRLRVGWSGRFAGYFKVGVSLIAPATDSPGYDRLGDNIAIPNYGGAYDTIADDKYGILNFGLTRGRDDQFANMLAGQLEVTFNDVWPGRYNPKNPSSPLFGDILPMRPCCFDATLDGGSSWIQLFNGWLAEVGSDVDVGGSAKFTFKDLFLWLERAKNVTIAPTGPTTVGAVINLCLDAVGWPATLRNISTGSSIDDFSLSQGTSVLTALAELLQVDLGYFFHSRDGYATYWDRYEMARKVSIGTFQIAKDANPGLSLDNVRNTATATKTGGVQQYWEDTESVNAYTANAWDDVESPYFLNDNDALGFCQMKVAMGAVPAVPVWTYTVQEGPSGYLPLILQAEFLDRVSIDAYGQVGDYYVQKMVHRGEGGALHQTDWTLSEKPFSNPFLVGVSTIAPASNSAGYDRIWH